MKSWSIEFNNTHKYGFIVVEKGPLWAFLLRDLNELMYGLAAVVQFVKFEMSLGGQRPRLVSAREVYDYYVHEPIKQWTRQFIKKISDVELRESKMKELLPIHVIRKIEEQ